MCGLQKNFVIKSIFFICLSAAFSPDGLAVSKSAKPPCVVGMLWTTGYEDLLEEVNQKETQTLLASPQLPFVDIGGEKFGSKRTFQAIRKFLEQNKNTSDILSFTTDHLTYWSNKKEFDQLCTDYPDRFRLSFFKDFIKQPEIQKYPKILPFLNTAFRLMPVAASDLFRLLAPCARKALNVDPAVTSKDWSWVYIDVDHMINAQEAGKNNALDKMLKYSGRESTQLFLSKPVGKTIYNDPLRIDTKKNSSKLHKFQNYILSVSPPLNKFSDSLSYFDNLVNMIKNTPTVENYTNSHSIRQREKIYNALNVTQTTGRGLIGKLRKILPTQCVELPMFHGALEWLNGVYLKKDLLKQEPIVRNYIAKNPKFLNHYMESAGIMNDLLKFSKAQKWLSWQNSCGKGLTYTNNLKKLIDIAFERLIQINPFPTKKFSIKEALSQKKKQCPNTAVASMLTWGNRLNKAYPDHPLMNEYAKKNKVLKMLPKDSL